jgi:hypothetical protein
MPEILYWAFQVIIIKREKKKKRILFKKVQA